ncbi:MAG: GntR family transcriptional regulator, partial [Caulobacterales bacterium]
MTATSSVGSSALVDMAIKHIDRLIGEGIIRPGDSISEPEVCSALSLGRVPVREAIRILAGERILELVPNKSARVRRIEPAELLERFELLSWLSAFAIQSLAEEGRNLEIGKTLKVIARRIEALGKGGDASLTLREINRFHGATIKACGNRYLNGMVERMRMNHYILSVVTILGHDLINASASKYPMMAEAFSRGEGAK